MRPQSLGRPDRLLNRAARHLAVSKRERPALGRFATRRLCNAGGSAVAPTKLDSRVSIRCYCSDARKPLVLLVWSYHRDAACALRRTFAMPQRQVRRSGSQVSLWIAGIALLLCSAFFGSHSLWGVSSAPRLPRCWPTWEIALLAVAVRPGVAQSSLEPEKFPRQHLSGRNHDRHRRHSELSKSNNSAVGL